MRTDESCYKARNAGPPLVYGGTDGQTGGGHRFGGCDYRRRRKSAHTSGTNSRRTSGTAWGVTAKDMQ
ncbi:hypothetical protein Scani_80270 [Streptomyces caniferus]|uniref:Uncharacterized protein n=1 Tax=Streptomyces caniferus TaxID=285557 RepID=A0A640SJZ3_9ACTN|nr:hypothetical protein Scani_80270 [Streptomyces caniferus]